MGKLLLAGAALAAPLLAWQPAHAAAAAPLNEGTALAPSASVQKAAWVWVGGHRVWRVYPGWGFGPGWGYYHPGWGYHPYWHRYGYWHPYHRYWAYRY